VHVALREARPADDVFLRSLFFEVRSEVFAAAHLEAAMLDSLLDMQFRAREMEYRRRLPDLKHYLIESKGTSVGALALSESDEIVLADIAVQRAHRGVGIGEAALRELIEKARKSGKAIVLHVDLANPARRLYKRLGFVETSRDEMNAEMRLDA